MDINILLDIYHLNKTRISGVDLLLRKPKAVVPAPGLNRLETTTESVFELLMHSHIRRGDRHNVDYRTSMKYQEGMQKFIDRSVPIEFVFQHFPFKCHNPYETMRRTPDLGEIAFLQRLLDINETVRQIYDPGVKFTVLAEGKTYQSLFGADRGEVDIYQTELNAQCQKVGANGIVEIIDFVDLLDDPNTFFDECNSRERTLTEDGRVDSVIPVMMRSLPIMVGMNISDLLAIFGNTPITELSENQLEILSSLTEDARGLALKYLAIMDVKRERKMIANMFPDKLYITTLPRDGIYTIHPIHRKTRLFPQHGVPVKGSDKVDIVFFGEVLANPNTYTAVYLEGDSENTPFYYLKGNRHNHKGK